MTKLIPSCLFYNGWPHAESPDELLCDKNLVSRETSRKISGLSVGTKTSAMVLPKVIDRVVRAKRGLSYRDDFYNRVHVFPSTISTGSIFNEQVETVRLWNASFNEQPLQSITEAENRGVQIVSEPFSSLGILAEQEIIVAVSMDGPESIYGLYAFEFLLNSLKLTVIGTRGSYIWPFSVDKNITEAFEYLTDIIPSYSGEQRRSLRDLPRRTLSHSHILREDDYPVAKNIATSAVNKTINLPLWHYYVRSGRLTDSTTSISVSKHYPFEIGDIVFITQGNSYEQGVVEEVGVGSVVLSYPVSKNYTNAIVCPTIPVTVAGGVTFTRKSKDFIACSAQFLELQPRISRVPYSLTYRGKPVLVDSFSALGDLALSDGIDRDLEVFDTAIAEPVRTPTSKYNTENLSVSFVTQTREERKRLTDFLNWCEGRFQSFWLPSQHLDLKLSRDALGGGDVLWVVGCLFTLDNGTRYIRVQGTEGVYHRAVIDASVIGDEQALSLDEPITGVDLLVADTHISTMALVRLAADRNEILHNRKVSSVNLSVTEVHDDI